jgi:hypothetical protein
MAITFTKKMLIERVRRHMADDFPSVEFGAYENEVLLYIDQALAVTLVGQVYNNAKIEGNLAVPEGYLTTYLLPSLTQNLITREWETTLPQPPVSLPLGYSIDDIYFANQLNGRGNQVFMIKQKRVSFRRNMPMPSGVRAWVEGSTLKMEASDGSSLLNQPVYVRMASTRTSNVDDIMSLPDDAIEAIFLNVTAKLKDRMQIPKDVIADDISAGNKSS